MIEVIVNEPVLVFMQLPDGNGTKGVRAKIRNSLGSLIFTVNLLHQGDGLYVGSFTPTTDGYYTAGHIVYTDGTYTTEDLGYTRRADLYRVVPELSLTSTSLAAIADAVWDESVASHTLPGTYGLYIDVIRQYANATNDEVVSGVHGLGALLAEIQNQGSLTRVEVNQNEVKIDALYPHIDAAKAAIQSDISDVNNDVDAIIPEIQARATDIIVEVNQNEVKIDTLTGNVGALQNNTTARFIVPERLIKPTTGTKTYQFHIRLYDNLGNPEAPDVPPTIRIRSLDTGTDIVLSAVMTQDGVKVGAYYYNHVISAGTAEAALLVEATVVEQGVTRYIPAVTEVTEFESDLNAIQAQLTSVETQTTDIQTKVNNPVYGLSAIKANHANIINEINVNESKIDLVKAKTDLIPADVATLASVAGVNATVLTRPTITDIQGRLDIMRDNIKGADNRDLTMVYDNFDISSVAKTNDPRFSYLDTPVSTRSILTASQVWSHGTRTLTDVVIPNTEIAKVWDYLMSQAITPGSFGKTIKDNLDAKVSTRATSAQVTAALAGVAQQATLLSLFGTVTTEANENEIKLNTIIADTTAIRGKTQNLPSDPASNSVVQAGNITTQSQVVTVQSTLNAVKTKTDNLPVNPAKETSVLSIPTNPLRDNDARLNRLDVNISTRGTANASDLAPLAKTSDVVAARNAIINEVDDNEAKIDAIGTLVLNIKARTDLIPNDPSRQSTLTAAEANILSAIAALPTSTGGATAAEVWSYANRSLSNPDLYKADVSNLATTADVANAGKTQYHNRMSTVFNNLSGEQEIIAWAEKNGSLVSAPVNCSVTVKSSTGTVVWSASLASPNGDGIFRFVNPISAGVDKNFYVVISIEVDGDARVSTQPFFTVG